MQAILSIDTSCEPAQAVVVGVDGKSLRVLESKSFSTHGLFGKEAPAPASDAPLESATGAAANGDGSPAGTPAHSGVPSEAQAPGATNGNGIAHASPLAEVLSSLKTPWSSSILIIPMHDYLSLNLALPFSDPAKVNKIIDLEVQDLIPFEVTDFLVNHRPIAPLGENSHDVHVSLMPKSYIRRVLQVCKGSNLEPLMVSTPAAVLGGVYHVAPDYFSGDSAVILAQDPYYYIATQIDGHLRTDRIISRPAVTNTDTFDATAQKALMLELKLTLSAVERRYGKKVETVYMFGRSLKTSELRQVLARTVEEVHLSELIKDSSDDTALGGMAALFARDIQPPPLLTNFRTKEFSYSPELRELFSGLQTLVPLLIAAIALVCATWGVQYYLRQSYMDKVQAAMRNEILKVIPDLDFETGKELQTLQAVTGKLQQELNNLGSQSGLSPLAAFAEVSQDFHADGITVNQLKIRGNKVTVDVASPEFSGIEKLEKALEKKKKVYCKLKKDANGVSLSNGPKKFTFELQLCD